MSVWHISDNYLSPFTSNNGWS